MGRRRTLLSRALLRVLAGEVLGVPPRSVWTGTSHYGAPQAGRPGAERPADRGLVVSVAHTVGMVAVAASRSAARLGVDVERLDRRTRPVALARRYYAPGEADELEVLPSIRRAGAFLRAWTLKEAWGKAAGVGVPRALPLVGFSMGGLSEGRPLTERRLRWLDPWAAERLPGAWRLWTVAVEGHTLGVAALPAPSPMAFSGPSLPLFAGSAMIRRFDGGWPHSGEAPVEIFRLAAPPGGPRIS